MMHHFQLGILNINERKNNKIELNIFFIYYNNNGYTI